MSPIVCRHSDCDIAQDMSDVGIFLRYLYYSIFMADWHGESDVFQHFLQFIINVTHFKDADASCSVLIY